jgi:hypothetical protein
MAPRAEIPSHDRRRRKAMFQSGKFAEVRSALSDLVAGMVFVTAVVLVVGGTTIMCLERAAIYA